MQSWEYLEFLPAVACFIKSTGDSAMKGFIPMRLLYLMILTIQLISSTIACTSDAKKSSETNKPSNVVIGEADNDKSFQIGKGSEITINLPANPTTGYSWAIEKADENVLALINDVYTPDQPVIPGSGGTQTLTFKAIKAGTAPVELKYWRPWEGNTSIAKHFNVTVQVND